MKRLIIFLLLAGVIGGGAFLLLTMPTRLAAAALPDEAAGDAGRGRLVFAVGGCASCHVSAKAQGDRRLRLGGGDPLVTQVGTFHAPNISTDPEYGIGAWSLADFANALQRGVAPDGSHLYPAFPYTSYIHMSPQDVSDLWAYMKTLPAVKGAAPDHELAFPFNIRRGIGLWKRFYLEDAPVVTLAADASAAAKRGRALAEGPGHCGECHTPRLLGGYGGLDRSAWLAGAPNPDGEGRVPDITPAKDGIGDWSEADIAYFFESGFTPDFDSVGGSMAEVQKNLAMLPASDREAIAAYLKAVPAQ